VNNKKKYTDESSSVKNMGIYKDKIKV